MKPGPGGIAAVILALMTMSMPATGKVSKRVPAEWEPQEAIWLQWPGRYEKAHETAFARMAGVIAEYLGLPVVDVDIVHERGNLEFNGVDAVILNWSTLGDPRRNPDYTRAQAEADLEKHFGVSRVVFVEGVPKGDLTNGHIDGIARFISSRTRARTKQRAGESALTFPGERCT